MEEAKIQLSAAEMALLCDAEIILTKNRIMEKAKELFASVQAGMQQTTVAAPFSHIPPKISRGENYAGLPYLMLDYPRLFGQEDVFAIRSFFWWGNFFSSTLHLAGTWKRQLAPHLSNAYVPLVQRGYFVQTGTDPWAHQFDGENFREVAAFTAAEFAALVQERPYIKIAARWPLESWPHAANNLGESWRFLLQRCGALNYFPGGETGLLPGNPTACSGL
jgi:tRNA splicing endonuclease